MLPVKIEQSAIQLINVPAVMQKVGSINIDIFKTAAGVMIRNMSGSDFKEDINTVLDFIILDVGLKRERVNEYQVTRIQQVVAKYYNILCIREIKLAFELLLVGELDEFLLANRYNEPDRSHYGELSADYFTKVLNAYQKRKTHANNSVNKAVGLLPKPGISDGEKRALEIDFARRCYQIFLDYKSEKEQPEFNFNRYIYKYMGNIGVSVASMDLADEDLIRAKGIFMQSKYTGPYEKMYVTSIGDAFKEHHSIVTEATSIRQIKAVKETFNSIITNKIDFKKLIEQHESIEI